MTPVRQAGLRYLFRGWHPLISAHLAADASVRTGTVVSTMDRDASTPFRRADRRHRCQRFDVGDRGVRSSRGPGGDRGGAASQAFPRSADPPRGQRRLLRPRCRPVCPWTGNGGCGSRRIDGRPHRDHPGADLHLVSEEIETGEGRTDTLGPDTGGSATAGAILRPLGSDLGGADLGLRPTVRTPRPSIALHAASPARLDTGDTASGASAGSRCNTASSPRCDPGPSRASRCDPATSTAWRGPTAAASTPGRHAASIASRCHTAPTHGRDAPGTGPVRSVIHDVGLERKRAAHARAAAPSPSPSGATSTPVIDG